MRSLRAWLSSVACMVCSALLLSGCSTSAEDEAKINSVITALPTEVAGCTFLGEVDSGSHTFTLVRGEYGGRDPCYCYAGSAYVLVA